MSFWSLPAWERGSKLVIDGDTIDYFGVAPRVGAWIETR